MPSIAMFFLSFKRSINLILFNLDKILLYTLALTHLNTQYFKFHDRKMWDTGFTKMNAMHVLLLQLWHMLFRLKPNIEKKVWEYLFQYWYFLYQIHVKPSGICSEVCKTTRFFWNSFEKCCNDVAIVKGITCPQGRMWHIHGFYIFIFWSVEKSIIYKYFPIDITNWANIVYKSRSLV